MDLIKIVCDRLCLRNWLIDSSAVVAECDTMTEVSDLLCFCIYSNLQMKPHDIPPIMLKTIDRNRPIQMIINQVYTVATIFPGLHGYPCRFVFSDPNLDVIIYT